MAYLVAGNTFADTYKFSLSMWFRAPSIVDGSPIFCLNDVGDLWPDHGYGLSIIKLYSSGIFGTTESHYPGPGPLGNFNENPFGWQMGTIATNAWHHFFAAIDITGSTTYVVGILDGVRDTNEWNVSYLNEYPGWPINLSTGGRATLGWRAPSPGESLPSPGIMEYADVQAWYGSYIDASISANFAKFVTLTGGRGYPVNPSTAAVEFGTQTILFQGKSSDNSFFFNRGTGGSFSKIGTTSDFVPAPSYG